MISKFGASMPAVGFAIDVDNILSVLEKQGNDNKKVNKKFLIHYENASIGSAYKFATRIRAKGFISELSLFENKEKSLKYGEQKNIDKMICIFEDEKVEIIDIKTKKSFKTSEEKLINSMGE